MKLNYLAKASEVKYLFQLLFFKLVTSINSISYSWIKLKKYKYQIKLYNTIKALNLLYKVSQLYPSQRGRDWHNQFCYPGCPTSSPLILCISVETAQLINDADVHVCTQIYNSKCELLLDMSINISQILQVSMSQTNQLLQRKETYKSKIQISLIIVNVALSTFYFGYCIVYFGQLDINQIKKIFSIDLDPDTAKGLLNGCTPIGALVGALASSFLISRLSRRKCLLLLNFIALIAGGLIYIRNFYTLFFFRCVQGFCVGAYSAIVPLIIMQLSPTEISGTLGSYSQLLVCFGVFFGCIFKYILYKITGDKTGQDFWKITFAVTQFTVGIQTLVLLFVFPYQTPKYWLLKGREDEARKLIEVIYKPQCVEQILKDKKNDLAATQTRQNVEVQTIISQIPQEQTKTNKIPVIVAIHLAVLQQLSGINAVAVYGGDIASNASSGQLAQLMASLINFEQVLATFVTGILLVKLGRKTILQFGSFFEGVGNLLVGIGFFIKGNDTGGPGQVLILVGLFFYMAIFGLSLGPVVWLYIPEVVQPNIVPFSTAANWICASLVIILFPILTEHVLNGNPAVLFLFFAAWCIVSFFFNQKFVIETKDKTQKQIQEEYSRLL